MGKAKVVVLKTSPETVVIDIELIRTCFLIG